ncbi:autotransporter-associated beta strand repeat-containing protein [Planctomycetota bacterium]|nr:autotransporter-associated beta strand repeat-containing protein [Planctomycetota bacterium]
MKVHIQSAAVLPAALAFITIGTVGFTASPASAATYTWNGDTNRFWTSDSNWTSDDVPETDVPESDDIVVFNGSSSNTAVYLNGDRTIQELMFGGNTNYDLTHYSTINTLTLANGNLTTTGSATHLLKYHINLGDNGIWSIDTPIFQVINNISGDHSLTKTGSGTLSLSGDSTYSGGTILSEGTLLLNSNNALGTGLVTVQGTAEAPTMDLANGVHIANDIKLLSDLYIKAAEGKRDVTYHAGVISGDIGANLIYNGEDSFAFTGNNTYRGNTIIESGTVQIGDGGTTGWIAGNIENHATLEFNRSDDITYDGVLSGPGDVYQFGTGTLTLTGDSTFGRLLADGGHLVVDGANIKLTANTTKARLVTRYGDMTIQNGADFEYIGASRIHNALTVTGSGTLLTGDQMYVSTHSTEKRFVVEDDAEVNIAGFFTIGAYGPGHISVQSGGKLSTGRFIVQGTSSGLITGSDSQLTINSNLFLYDSSGLAVNDGAGVEVTGYTKVGTPEGFTIDGGTFKTDQLIVNNTSTPTISISGMNALTIGHLNGSSTYQGFIQDAEGGAGELIKVGTGTFTLTQANTYTGSTKVFDGTLLVNNSSDSATGSGNVIVRDSGTLGGNGFIEDGRVILYTGGTLAPGQSAGHLTVENITFYHGDTTLEIELGGLADTEYDVLSILGSAVLGEFGSPQLDVSLIDGFTLDLDQQFDIVNISGIRYGEFDGLSEGALVNSFDDIGLFITYQAGDGNDIALYTAAIPEPTSYVMLGLGGLVHVLRRSNRMFRNY